MKRIGIDARLIKQTGVGVYTYNLLTHLDTLVKDIEIYVFLRDKDMDAIDFENKLFKKVSANYHWHSFNEQVGFLRLLHSYNLDLMHFTYFSYPTLYNRDFIITIHDLIPLLFSTGRASTKNPLSYLVKRIGYKHTILSGIKKSKAILTPTNSVKESITENVPSVNSDKIHVTYEGVTSALMDAKEDKKLEKEFNRPFLLYVGNFYPHKNVDRLIRGFAKAKSELDLVLLGPDDYFSSRMHKLVEEMKTQRIHFYHNANLSDFVFFYKNAKALVHPSLSEGFGLPLVEASYFKCPIVASDIDVFNEILGEKRNSFDPYSVKSISTSIENISKRKPSKNDYIDSKKLNDTFTFKNMAKETLKIYKDSI